MIEEVIKILQGKKVLILGFGLEGKSSYTFLRTFLSDNLIGLADQNENAFETIHFQKHTVYFGEDYLSDIQKFEFIIKSPGIPESVLPDDLDLQRVTSQTNLFLKAFSAQTIGITGTKGKSTTSSLIYHIFKKYKSNCILVGNIGKPPFDYIQQIDPQTTVVYELSAHQLADVNISPATAILLNIFQEHLDHYKSFQNYIDAKLKIGAFQHKNNLLVINADDPVLAEHFQQSGNGRKCWFSAQIKVDEGAYVLSDQKIMLTDRGRDIEFDFVDRVGLPGKHNLQNIMAAVCACKLNQIPDDIIFEGVMKFRGLEHRLEYVGEFGSIHFYNDSISTIPQATIAALDTLPAVDTLILGGKDRGIDYSILVDFLTISKVKNVIFTGPAGKRIMDLCSEKKPQSQRYVFVNLFGDIENVIRQCTPSGGICLLSPAASSYDQFLNFEERGRAFKKIAGNFAFPAS